MSTSNADKQNDRVWFVTGASSGLGRAISQAVLARGHRLVAATRTPGAVQALVHQHPDRALATALDVTDASASRAAVSAAVARFGRLDVVVNNAGYGHVGAVEELSDAELREQFDVNLFGVINITRAALPHMRRQRSGHIVQMSSLNGVEGLAGGGYYAASKFAIEGLSESLADEVASLGIRVTIVEPGPHRTRFANERSAPRARPISDYSDSVGRTREIVSRLDGNQPGDPARAADAILRAVESDDPPLRLPLGQMALDNIRARLDAQLQELEAWAPLSATSDFPSDQASDRRPSTGRAP
jgi:NAD(P)-dependent dehydrogenase (short-subunit alcohol dehydrogenase family)